MADFTKTVDIIFGGRDDVSRAVRDVSRSLQSLETGVADVARPLAAVTDAILKVDTVLVALGATMVGVAINSAAKFQTAFGEITTLFEAPADQVARFSGEILNFSRDSTQSIESINRAVYSAISAGVSWTDALDLLTVSEKLAVGGVTDLDSATRLILGSLNAYGQSTQKATEFSDALFTTVRLGQTTIPELSASLAQVTGIAASAGVSFDELMSAIATLTVSGTPTAQAVTSIRAAIAALLNPSSEAEKLAAQLGIEFNATALKTKGFAGVLEEVATKTKGSTEQMNTLFGSTEALKGVLVLTGAGADKFAAALEAMGAKAGATQAAYEKMVENVKEQTQILKNNIEATLILAGTRLLEQFVGDIKGLTEIFKQLGFSLNEGAFDEVFAAFNAFGRHIEETLLQIAKNLPAALEKVDFSGLLDAFGELGGTIGTLFDNVDITTTDGLASVIQKLVDTGESLVRVTADIVKTFKPLFDSIASGVDSFNQLDDSSKALIGNVLGIGEQVDILLPLFNSLVGAINGVALALAAAAFLDFGKVLTALTGGAGKLAGPLGVAGLAVAVGTLAFKATEWADINDRLVPGAGTLGTAIYDLFHGVDDLNSSLENSVNIFDKTTVKLRTLAEVEQDIAVAHAKLGLSYDTLTGKVTTFAEVEQDIAVAHAKLGLSYDTLTGKVTTFAEVEQEIADATEKNTAKSAGWMKTVVDGVVTYEQFGDAASKSLKKVTQDTDDATKKSESFQLKLLELANDERLKRLEFKVNLDIANIEADTQRIAKAFDVINTAIETTGTSINTALGALDTVSGFFGLEKLEVIKEQLRRDSDARDRALEMQEKLTDAQVSNLQAKTDLLRSGRPVIEIDGSGLAPELEAFMFAVIERVQVRVNEEASELLLGIS